MTACKIIIITFYYQIDIYIRSIVVAFFSSSSLLCFYITHIRTLCLCSYAILSVVVRNIYILLSRELKMITNNNDIDSENSNKYGHTVYTATTQLPAEFISVDCI